MSLPSPDDIQGDIVNRMLKDVEDFMFFRINDPTEFRAAIPKLLDLQPATGTHIIEARKMVKNIDKSAGRVPLSFFNIGFSKDGLRALGIDDTTLSDPYFSLGQLDDAQALGDTGKTENGAFMPDWEPEFLERIDGVVLVAADCLETLKPRVAEILQALGDAVKIVYTLQGKARPKELGLKGREHFGWMDGISNPAVPGLTEPIHKGQRVVPPGILLVGADGDPFKSCRPAWAVNGSFMVFRQLNQLVPEFKQYLKQHPVTALGLSPEDGSKLRCAWFFGRWPSGTPLELSPLKDDPEIANDPERVNNFIYSPDQERCPYAAHIRKVNPRNMLSDERNVKHSIMRAGIAFGDEIGKDIDETTTTKKRRGLAFVAYQSVIDNGFRTQQMLWANNPTFPPNEEHVYPGFDAIIGQDDGKPRITVDSQGKPLQLPNEFVISRGGGYFFMPSIPALKGHFSPTSPS